MNNANPFLNIESKSSTYSLFGNIGNNSFNKPLGSSDSNPFNNQNNQNNGFNLFGNTPGKPESNKEKDKNDSTNPFNIFPSFNQPDNNEPENNKEKKEEQTLTNNSIIGKGSLFFNNDQNNNKNLLFGGVNDNSKNSFTILTSTQEKNRDGGLFGNDKSTKENNKESKQQKESWEFKNPFFSNNTQSNKLSLFNNNKENKNENSLFEIKNKDKNNDTNIFNEKKFCNDNEEETPMSTQKKEKKENITDTNNNTNNNNNFNPFQKPFESNTKKQQEQNNLFNLGATENNENNFSNIKDTISKVNNNIEIDQINNENNEVINSQREIELNNNIYNEENNNENEEQEMELEEEIKNDSSSINSDIINNLWISDNEEIIDDDIDINKKIDYKKLEEQSKNKENKINDINLLILPELSEYYFQKSKSISDYYTLSDSNIREKFSIDISRKIIDILSNIINEKELDEEKKSELINITTIYIYFDAFILHRNDVIYLMKLRDELLYKYYFQSETLIDFEKKNKNIIENNNLNSIIINLKKIYFHLTMLDINKAYNQVGSLIQIFENIYRNKIFGDKTMTFKDLFMNLEKIIKIYNNIFSLKENFNSKQIISSFNMLSVFKEIVELINDIQYSRENMNEDIKKIMVECQKIIGLLTGNMESLINDYNHNNIHLLILANIFYRFYKNDFIKGIGECLQKKKEELDLENNLINKMILKIIQNCDGNQIEIVQILKGNYPFLIRYHMIEILSQNAFLFQVENQEKYLKKEAFFLFQSFKDMKIPFKYHLNYISFYPNHEIFTVETIDDIDKLDEDPIDELKEAGYRKALDYALIYINSRFNNEENVEEINNEIDDIKNELRSKIIDTYSNDIIYKINKLCIIKYNERNAYKYSILSYIENYNLENKDLQKLQIKQQRNQLCADNEFNFDYPKQFDKVIINYYLDTKYVFNQESFEDMYENNKMKIDQDFKNFQELLSIILTTKEKSSIDNIVQFIINYTQFLLDVMRHNLNLIEKNNKYNTDIVLSCKKFFNDCFPLPKCPIFIWYHVLMIIKSVIDENMELFNNDTFIGESEELCEELSIWDKKLIYEIIKIEKINRNKINVEEANNMYENAISFVNDITQGFYFNQNIYSN